MATLKMEVESCKSIQKNIESLKSQMEEQANQVNSIATNMVGNDWISPAADEFLSKIVEWNNQQRQLVERLQEINIGFMTEITQWEDTASRMGG